MSVCCPAHLWTLDVQLKCGPFRGVGSLRASQEHGTCCAGAAQCVCSTASAGIHNLVKVGDGDGNVSFPLKEVDLGKKTQPVIFASILV